MSVFSCFTVTTGKKKKDREDKPVSCPGDYYEKLRTLQARSVQVENKISINPKFNMKIMSHESPIDGELAYEGENEQEENLSIKRDNSDLAFQRHIVDSSEENSPSMMKKIESYNSMSNISDNPYEEDYPLMRKIGSSSSFCNINDSPSENHISMIKKIELSNSLSNNSDNPYEKYPTMMKKIESFNSFSNISDDTYENNAIKDNEEDHVIVQSGNISDPGIGKQNFLASPKLVRSCSFVETNEGIKKIAYQLPSSKDKSYEKLNMLAEKMHTQVLRENNHSPRSVTSHHSADRVILKKHSSSQILPSRSKRLWWKLFLWSHRNIQKPLSKARSVPMNQQGGYCSDNYEQNGPSELSKMESPNSFTEPSTTRGNDENTPCWDGYHGGGSGFWPQNQWVALSVQSPLPRVEQWVQELADQPILAINDNDDDENHSKIDYPPSPEASRSPSRNITHVNRRPNLNLSEEIMHANSVIQSLNLSSTVAHISGVGLKVIPTLSQFCSLRSVNLSGNSITNVTPGSLPKGLHTLNLSRNKITTIGGFRELTRLRVLDLSYNKISRIGHGLSNCTLIKELYLAGNKISEVEGLHRLLKLSLLDLSFNKISTTKAIGQLVANYNTLLALNLLGDPIQNNLSEDQLRKAVSGLLPKLAYLNKQPVNSQKAREVATESIVKAALGNSNWSSRKRVVRKVSNGKAGHRSTASIGQTTSRQSVKGRAQRK